ncbi:MULTISPECIES: helix-turn-helix domain-containing protein [unclassified Methylibium]|uniref:helix-turn-helix domain-containing protein n=1 Tax=unclassified Methylibium TaxID=2633235 RepID=UPI0003F4023E|nr:MULTISPECIES: helix-turn-helix domain-containing protein [unclassified Methylibium]EWS54011.1 transcriptional regulator, y4mF family [Methylibium sp. T29]EWS58352.1 transcriptional regulator, y4mF family [Methylibium sp. T29-B]
MNQPPAAHAVRHRPSMGPPRHDRLIGPALRAWRDKRRLSQLALALDVGVSTRHLSFVETGRSRPSAELVMALAERLELPLRERNELLLAAGFAPRFPETPLSSPDLDGVQRALRRLLDAHDPYPGVALDRHWNVVLANAAAARLVAALPDALRKPSVNMIRAGLHPQGFAAVTANFDEWGRHLVTELAQLAESSADATLAALLAEVSAYPNVRALLARPAAPVPTEHRLLLPCVFDLGGTRLTFFTTLARLGSPRDVTLSELSVELFYPADGATEKALRHAL